jgi:aspartyl-tRNA(Asn)/glutamyl-tRNA(Gln) amidotransferase subunit C
MTKITKEELVKIAHISQLRLYEEEIPSLIKQIQDLLTYAERVKEVADDTQLPSDKNSNVVREDVVVRTDPEPLLDQAPEREDDFFVVPKIIENNK